LAIIVERQYLTIETSCPFTVKTVPSLVWQTSHKPEPAKSVVLPNGNGLPFCANKNVWLIKKKSKVVKFFFHFGIRIFFSNFFKR
jgi:hypothetical protein